jgi:hypothetical protein
MKRVLMSATLIFAIALGAGCSSQATGAVHASTRNQAQACALANELKNKTLSKADTKEIERVAVLGQRSKSASLREASKELSDTRALLTKSLDLENIALTCSKLGFSK